MSCEDFPIWDSNNEKQSVERLYTWAIKKTHDQIEWYREKRMPQKKWSQIIRWSALILASLGALCPLISPVLAATRFNGLKFSELGYVFFAAGAAFLAFDRYYGFSNSWIRSAAAQLSLETTMNEFFYDWILLQSQPFSAQGSIQKIKEFKAKVDGIVKQETDAWIAEFKSNIAELEKMLKTGAEARKSGSIKLTVSNSSNFDCVQILLDGGFIKEIKGVSEALLDMVPPGQHEVTVTAIDGSGKEHKESKVVEVTPDTSAPIEITIK